FLEHWDPVLDAPVDEQFVRYALAPGRGVMLAQDDVKESVTVHVAEADAAHHVVAALLACTFVGEQLTRDGQLLELALAVIEEDRVKRPRAQEVAGPTVVVPAGTRPPQPWGLLGDADGVGHVLELEVASITEETGSLRLRAVIAGNRIFTDEDVEQP